MDQGGEVHLAGDHLFQAFFSVENGNIWDRTASEVSHEHIGRVYADDDIGVLLQVIEAIESLHVMIGEGCNVVNGRIAQPMDMTDDIQCFFLAVLTPGAETDHDEGFSARDIRRVQMPQTIGQENAEVWQQTTFEAGPGICRF